MTAVRKLIEERSFDVPFPLEVRFVAPDDAFLSPAFGRQTCYLAAHMFEGMEWDPYFRAVEDIMDGLGGRPHWGKRHFQSAGYASPPLPGLGRVHFGSRSPRSREAIRERLHPAGACLARVAVFGLIRDLLG